MPHVLMSYENAEAYSSCTLCHFTTVKQAAGNYSVSVPAAAHTGQMLNKEDLTLFGH